MSTARFDAANCTGAYELELSLPPHREVLQWLCTVSDESSSSSSSAAAAKGAKDAAAKASEASAPPPPCDTSQRGDGSSFRNSCFVLAVATAPAAERQTKGRRGARRRKSAEADGGGASATNTTRQRQPFELSTRIVRDACRAGTRGVVSTDFVSSKLLRAVPTACDAEFEGVLDDVLGSRTEPSGRYGEGDGRPPRGTFLVALDGSSSSGSLWTVHRSCVGRRCSHREMAWWCRPSPQVALLRLAVASRAVTSRQVMRMLDRGASLTDTTPDELASLAVALFSRVVDPEQFLTVISSSASASVTERVIKRLGRLNLYSPYTLEGRHAISFEHADDRRFVKVLARLGVAEWVSRHEREMEAQGGFVLAGFEGAVDYEGVRPLQEDFDNPSTLDIPFLTVSGEGVDCIIIVPHSWRMFACATGTLHPSTKEDQSEISDECRRETARATRK